MTLEPFVAQNDEVDALWQVDILWMMLATSEQTGGAHTLIGSSARAGPDRLPIGTSSTSCSTSSTAR